MAQMIVMIDKQGNTETVVKGIAGARCTQVTAELLQGLGTVVANTQTEEYNYVPNDTQVTTEQTQQNVVRVHRF